MESISTTCLIDLAFDLSVDWRKLARALGLANEVQRIDEDYRKNVFEQAYRMLQTWKRRNASKATYQALGKALSTQVVSRNDLAQKYCEEENRGSLETEIDLQGLLKNGHVSMSDIMSIAKDLGKDWLWVGRLLGLEDTALDGIKEACAEMYECSYKMLELWVKRRKAQAAYQCLARALLHRTVGMRDVAEKYCLDHRESQTASFVPPEEGIQQINEKMEHLQLSGLSKETGVAGSPVNIQSSTEAEEPGATHDNTRDVETLAATGSPEENDNKESGVTVLPSAAILSRTLSNIAIQEEGSQSPENKLSKESKSEEIICL